MKYVIYTRVSTKTQGDSGLGLESQINTCMNYIRNVGGECVAQYQDIESGTSRTRKGLEDAITFCKANKCTLVIARLDRLARDVEFTFRVINTGINIYFCDMPQMNTMILGVFASVAQYERELTSKRTKAALSEVKNRIKKGGGRAVSKSGNIVTHLGSAKGADISHAWQAAAESHRIRKESDTEWQKAKRLVDKLRREGCNAEYIHKTINDMKLKTRRGNDYSLTAIYRIMNA